MSGKNWAATQGLRLRGGGKKRETSGQRPVSEYELKLLKNIEDNKCERLALGLDTAAEQMRRAPKRPVQTSALSEVLDATSDAKRRLSPRLQMAPYTNGPSPNYLEHPNPPAQRHFATHLATTPPADNGDSDGVAMGKKALLALLARKKKAPPARAATSWGRRGGPHAAN